jgi:hypothetical protein
MDYIENYTFNTQEGGGSGGIPLHIYGTEYLGGGSGSGSESGYESESIYFPGGLFVNSGLLSSSSSICKDFDHTTKNIFEQYDTFIDLVSTSTSSSNRKSKSKSKKKIIFKKPKKKSVKRT